VNRAPPAGWADGVRELRFTFGEFRIATARLRAWSSTTHFLDAARLLERLPPFAEVPADVRVLAIQSVPVDGDLPAVATLRDAIRYVPAHFHHHCIELSGTFEDYLAALSGKSRHELARKVRRFEAHAGGSHVLRECRTPGEVAEFLGPATALSRMTYQGRLLAAGLPEGPAFAAEVAAAAARGDVRGYLLSIGEAPVAYGYCRARGDVLAFEHTGYDPALAAHSPGIFLLAEMLKRVFAEKRFRVFDFGSGDAQYKRSYATTSRRCATVLQFRKTLANRALVGCHRSLTATSDACVRVLKTLGVKDRVKRMLRRAGSAEAAGRARGGEHAPAEAGTPSAGR
jgi:CelD/BcsL family acetyltransferase involved in cellulose biosynthesis